MLRGITLWKGSRRGEPGQPRSPGVGRDPSPLEPREGSFGFIASFHCSVGYMSVSESYALK